MAFKTADVYILGDFKWLCILCPSNRVTMRMQSFHKLTHMSAVRGATKIFPKFHDGGACSASSSGRFNFGKRSPILIRVWVDVRFVLNVV